MSELTTLLLAEHRRAATEAHHPARAMAYELALATRLEGRPHWWSRWGTRVWSGGPARWSPSRVTAQEAEGMPGRRHAVPRLTPCEPDC